MKKEITIILSSLILAGCGGTSSEKKNDPIINIDKTPIITSTTDKVSKNYYGVLGDATVNIYSLGEGPKQLIYTEKTSTGSSVDAIGNFNPHSDSLNSKKFYLYEVIGGRNWDVDNDGNIDNEATANKTIYRSINRGSKNHVLWWDVTASSGEETVISGEM